MASERDGAVLRHVGRIFGAGTAAGMSDGQLLERVSARRDEAAFEALMERHGPMVLAVCRGLLADPNDADDAFQATFLVLARRAGAVRVEASLGPWLHGVTHRVAARCRADAARRAARRCDGVESIPAPAADPDLADLRRALHEEVDRLPEKYRAPIVLCYLQGHTHDQAAAALRWPVGTVRGRLARARDLLRPRLVRRGLAPSAGLFAACLPRGSARAAVPEALARRTLSAATGLLPGAGRLALVGAAPSAAASLSDGVLRSMMIAKLKLAAAVLLAGTAAVGARVAAHPPKPRPADVLLARTAGAESEKTPTAPAPTPPPGIQDRPDGRAEPTPYTDAALVPYGPYTKSRPGGQTHYDANISQPLDVSGKRLARLDGAAPATEKAVPTPGTPVPAPITPTSAGGPTPTAPPLPTIPPPRAVTSPEAEPATTPPPNAPDPPAMPSDPADGVPLDMFLEQTGRQIDARLSALQAEEQRIKATIDGLKRQASSAEENLRVNRAAVAHLRALQSRLKGAPTSADPAPPQALPPGGPTPPSLPAPVPGPEPTPAPLPPPGPPPGTPVSAVRVGPELSPSPFPGPPPGMATAPEPSPDLQAQSAPAAALPPQRPEPSAAPTPSAPVPMPRVEAVEAGPTDATLPPPRPEPLLSPAAQFSPAVTAAAAPPPADAGRDRRLDELEGKLDRLMKRVEGRDGADAGGRADRNDLVTRDYDATDLVAASGQGPARAGNAADLAAILPLVALITRAVAPASWKVVTPDLHGTSPPSVERTGPDPIGTITPNPERRLLTIRHTPEVHEQVAAFLRQLRSLRGLHPPEGRPADGPILDPADPRPLRVGPASGPAPDGPPAEPAGPPAPEPGVDGADKREALSVLVVTRAYAIGAGDPRAYAIGATDRSRLVELITAKVEPGTWRVGMARPVPLEQEEMVPRRGREPLGAIELAGDTLLVRHTHEVHYQVRSVLDRLRSRRAPDAPAPGPASGAGPHPADGPRPEPADPDEPPANPAGPLHSEAQSGSILGVSIDGPDRRLTNTLATYRIAVDNVGMEPLQRVRVSAALPSGGRLLIPKGASFDPARRVLTWPDLPRVGPGDVVRLDFKVLMGGVGRYEVVAEARAEAFRPVKVSRVTHVDAIADVGFDVIERARVMVAGEETEFEIPVRNAGSRDASRVLVAAKVSDHLEFVGTSGTDKPAVRDPKDPTTLLFPALDRLAPGKDLRLAIKVKALKPGVANCRISLMHDDLGGVPISRDMPVTIVEPGR